MSLRSSHHNVRLLRKHLLDQTRARTGLAPRRERPKGRSFDERPTLVRALERLESKLPGRLRPMAPKLMTRVAQLQPSTQRTWLDAVGRVPEDVARDCIALVHHVGFSGRSVEEQDVWIRSLVRLSTEPTARAHLLKLLGSLHLRALDTTARTTFLDVFTGPRLGPTANNERDLLARWRSARMTLLKAMSAPQIGPYKAMYAPSRWMFVLSSVGALGRLGIVFGDPASIGGLAYFRTVIQNEGQTVLRMVPSFGMDPRFAAQRTFRFRRTKLSILEEHALVSWIQENHAVGISWKPKLGQQMRPLTENSMASLPGTLWAAVAKITSFRDLTFEEGLLQQGRVSKVRPVAPFKKLSP